MKLRKRFTTVFWRNYLENKSKAATFIGFAIRKGSYKIGVNAIFTLKKANLLILCKSAGSDTTRHAIKLSKRFNCKLLKTEEVLLSTLTFRENAKLMAITDSALSVAIQNNSANEFVEVLGD